MGLNETVSAERVQIGFFGMRNAGKSSLVNAVTGQELSVVSEVKGTTTDPVRKAMELLPLGPVVIIDTPGLDDEGALGEKRVQKARRVLAQVDAAVLVVDALAGLRAPDRELMVRFKEEGTPYLIAYNKADALPERETLSRESLYVSARTGENVWTLKERLGALVRRETTERHIVGDLLSPGQMVVMVTPIDRSAPKGRLILPQQMTLRDILDSGSMALVTKETELPAVLARLSAPPDLVITDSQVFGKVAAMLPPEVPLTSFSILFARYKGELMEQVRGAAALSRLKDGDRVLISEGCTHHRQCGDIGSEKIPAWIREFSLSEPIFEVTSGGDFPEDLTPYRLVVHCGGCMLPEKELKRRVRAAAAADVPVVNYGVAIARMHGVLERSLALFPGARSLLTEQDE